MAREKKIHTLASGPRRFAFLREKKAKKEEGSFVEAPYHHEIRTFVCVSMFSSGPGHREVVPLAALFVGPATIAMFTPVVDAERGFRGDPNKGRHGQAVLKESSEKHGRAM